MRIVQRLRDGGHEVGDLGLGHPVWIALPQQARRVGAVHIIHRDPQLAIEVATIVHADDMWMPQRGRDVGFAVEPLPILAVRRHGLGQYLQRVAAGQPRMLGQIDLTHATRAEHPHDGVTSEGRTIGQRHGRIVQTQLRIERQMRAVVSCRPAVSIRDFMAGFGDILEWAKHQVSSRVPKADLDQRDPDYIREQLPGTWLLASLYFRADVRGLDRIPAEGPVLLVGNHSGGNGPPDTFVFTLAFCSYFGVERPFYQLAHNLVVSMPGLGSLRKFGTVAANHDNASLALQSGGALLVYPGGDYEVFRPSWERHEVDFGGRRGYVKLAREAGVRIVPIASIGGQEAALSLDRRHWLARLLGVDKMARLKSVPIRLAPPWGLAVSDMVPPLPLPTKIAIEVQDPIDADDIAASDDDVVHKKVEASLQAGVDRLAAERRFPVLG